MREHTDRLDAAKASDAWTQRAARARAGPPRRLAAGRPAHDPVLRPDRHPHRPRRGDLPHRPPPRLRRPRRPRGRRLAGSHLHRLLPRLAHRADGRRAASPVRGRPRPPHGVRGRAPHRRRRAPSTAASSPRRSSGPARARCATSSRRSSPSRTRSSAATSAPASASRAPPGRARPPSACTAPRGCSTPSARSSTGPACSSSAPTVRSSTTSAPCCPPSARSGSVTRRSTPSSTTVGSAPRTPRPSRSSRATPASPRCCAEPSGRTSAAPTRRSSSRAGPPLAGARLRGPRRRRRPRRPRRALLRGPRPAPPAPRPPRAAADGAHRRLPRRPRAGHRRPVGAGHGVRQGALAGARPGRRALPRSSRTATLTAAADGVLTADEQRMLLWDSPPRTKGAARWTRADMALLDEVADLLDRTPSLGHVVLDEAQDLSPMQLRAVGRRASTGSLTVLGDIAQGTTPWATESWGDAMGHLGRSAARARGPRPRLPGARPGHRLRRPAAARTWRPGSGPRGRCATTPAGSHWCRPTGDGRAAAVIDAVRAAWRARLGRRHRHRRRDRRTERGPHRRGDRPRPAGCRPRGRRGPPGGARAGEHRQGPGVRPRRRRRAARHRRRRARPAHRPAPALRGAHPRGVASSPSCTPSRCRAPCCTEGHHPAASYGRDGADDAASPRTSTSTRCGTSAEST